MSQSINQEMLDLYSDYLIKFVRFLRSFTDLVMKEVESKKSSVRIIPVYMGKEFELTLLFFCVLVDLCISACYSVSMKAIQYTIRNIPESVNRYLRKKAWLTGMSLNQVIVNELSEKVSEPSATVGMALSWFIGSGMDDATLLALDEEDKLQKELAAKDL